MTADAPARARPSMTERGTAWLLVAALLAAEWLIIRKLRPEAQAMNAAHAGMLGWLPSLIGGFGVPFVFVARDRNPYADASTPLDFGAACFAALAILWSLEVFWLLFPGRVFDVADLLAALVGVGAAWLFHRGVWLRVFGDGTKRSRQSTPEPA